MLTLHYGNVKATSEEQLGYDMRLRIERFHADIVISNGTKYKTGACLARFLISQSADNNKKRKAAEPVIAGISRHHQCRTFTGTLNLGIATLAEAKVRFGQDVKFGDGSGGFRPGYGRPTEFARWIASGNLPVGFRPAAAFFIGGQITPFHKEKGEIIQQVLTLFGI